MLIIFQIDTIIVILNLLVRALVFKFNYIQAQSFLRVNF